MYDDTRHLNCNVLFQIKVTDINEPPTDIDIIGSWDVEENSPAGTMIGTLTTVDSDVGQQYTYSLLAVAQRFLLLFKYIHVKSGKTAGKVLIFYVSATKEK